MRVTVGGRARIRCVRRERPEEAHLDDAHLLPLLHERADGLLRRLAAGAHQDDDPLRLGVAGVAKQFIAAADPLGKLLHHLLDDVRRCQVVGVCPFPRLEEHVGVLSRSPHVGAIRGNPPALCGGAPGTRRSKRGCRRRRCLGSSRLHGRCESRQRRARTALEPAASPPARSRPGPSPLARRRKRAFPTPSAGRPSRRCDRQRSKARAWQRARAAM